MWFIRWLLRAVLGVMFAGIDQALIMTESAVQAMAQYMMTFALRGFAAVQGKRMFDEWATKMWEWVPYAKTYFDALTGVAKEVGEEYAPEEVTEVRNWVRDIGRTYLSALTAMVFPTEPLSPEHGIQGVRRYLGVNMLFNLQGWWLSYIGEIMSAGLLRSIGQFTSGFSWSFGLCWLTWAVLGPQFELFVGTPYRWKMNQLYFPYRPDIQDTIRLFVRNIITPEEYEYLRGINGISEQWASALVLDALRQLSMSEVRELYQHQVIDEEFIDEWIRRQGYDPNQHEVVKWLITNRRLARLIDDFVDVVIDRYQDDVFSYEEARSYLENLPVSEDEKNWLFAIADAKKLRKEKLTVAQLVELYNTNQITYQELLDELENRGYSREDAQKLISITVDPNMPFAARPKPLPTGVIIRLLKTERIDWDTAVQLMMEHGYDSFRAALYLIAYLE